MRRPIVSFATAALVALVLASVTPTQAAERQPFDSAKFAAAQAANRPILLKFVAADCPICARQEPFLTEMENGPELTDLIVFTVDIDKDADVVHRFNVQQEGTLIVFHGKTERARSTGDTNPTSLKVLMLSGNAS